MRTLALAFLVSAEYLLGFGAALALHSKNKGWYGVVWILYKAILYVILCNYT